MTTNPDTAGYLEPVHVELDRLRAENEMKERLLATMDHWADVAETCERKANESHARREVAERALEQAEARVDQLTDTLTQRSEALNRTGADNDKLRATLTRIDSTLRLIAPEHITPHGARLIRAALAHKETNA